MLDPSRSPTAFGDFSMIPFNFKELIKTESNYVHALDLILSCERPLGSYLRREDNQQIFSHIKYFQHLHSNLHNDLMKAVVRSSNGYSPRISMHFINLKDKFLRYGEYCVTVSKIQPLLLDENLALEHDGDEYKLTDLLSLPMQRILKYHLLLEQIIKNTNDDYHGLRRAHEVMVDISQHINQVKRDTETLQIVNEIQDSIGGLEGFQLTDYGRLITDGFVRVKLLPEEQKKKLSLDAKRYVFVFDKVILVCKMSGVKRYQVKRILLLDDCKLDINPTSEKSGHGFNLILPLDQVYTFQPKSFESKTRWTEAISKAIDNNKPEIAKTSRIEHDFIMHTFPKATYCDECRKLLAGLYFQGYRCRCCLNAVHKKCLTTTRPCGPALPPRPSNLTQSLRLYKDSNKLKTSLLDCESVRMHMEPIENLMHDTNLLLTDPISSEPGDAPYVNNRLALTNYEWYYGQMERDTAQNLLEHSPHGTFIVRVSPKRNSFVISLNYNSQVKHMRIYATKDNQLYLSQNRYFDNLVELVSWYENNSLVESFHMLDARLSMPLKQMATTLPHQFRQ